MRQVLELAKAVNTVADETALAILNASKNFFIGRTDLRQEETGVIWLEEDFLLFLVF